MAIRMATFMLTETESVGSAALARLRLMQLVSPTLPIGAFSYSQGLEMAVECAWVTDLASFEDWMQGLLEDGLACLDLPVLLRLYQACERGDEGAITHWGQRLYASRETRELRDEERNRARAMLRLSVDLEIPQAEAWREALSHCQAAPFALAAVHWSISPEDCLLGYAWGWLENQVTAAIKLIPLGQTDGQRVQLALAERLPPTVRKAQDLDDDDIGASAPAMAVASARHETQYTRLFRS